MRKTETPTKLPKNLIESQSNAIGLTEMKRFKKDAVIVLSTAKSQEAQKILDGHKWMRKGSTTVLVKPSNIAKYTSDGYRLKKL